MAGYIWMERGSVEFLRECGIVRDKVKIFIFFLVYGFFF